MTNWLTILYNLVSAAHIYYIGFALDGFVYLVKNLTFAELSRYFRKSVTSSRKGKAEQVRIFISDSKARELLPQAERIGTVAEIMTMPNCGECFEKYCVERFTGKKWSKDSTKFWIAGDMVVNGEQVQIKFNNATLTDEKVLRNNFPDLVVQAGH